jgi:hypothetical protein
VYPSQFTNALVHETQFLFITDLKMFKQFKDVDTSLIGDYKHNKIKLNFQLLFSAGQAWGTILQESFFC